MVIISHDREFLDQLCTKIVETERGRATTFVGNYTQYVQQKRENVSQQWAAWEKQQKEILRQVDTNNHGLGFCTTAFLGFFLLVLWRSWFVSRG